MGFLRRLALALASSLLYVCYSEPGKNTHRGLKRYTETLNFVFFGKYVPFEHQCYSTNTICVKVSFVLSLLSFTDFQTGRTQKKKKKVAIKVMKDGLFFFGGSNVELYCEMKSWSKSHIKVAASRLKENQ